MNPLVIKKKKNRLIVFFFIYMHNLPIYTEKKLFFLPN